MTAADVLLAAAALAATGIATALAIRLVRLRADCRAQDRQMAALHRQADLRAEGLAAMYEELRELAPAIADAQRRWGFRLGPCAAAAVAEITPEAASRWLMRNAPGIGRLSEGQRATETFFAKPAAGAWTPPRVLVEPEQRKPAGRRRRAVAR